MAEGRALLDCRETDVGNVKGSILALKIINVISFFLSQDTCYNARQEQYHVHWSAKLTEKIKIVKFVTLSMFVCKLYLK